MPYMSVYMLSLGLDDRGIGLVTSLGLSLQVVAAILGGPVTDKLGRKRATFIFDCLSWSVPCLIWAFAQNMAWFIAAALFNALMQIPRTSWTCLLVEDAPDRQLVNIWSLISIAVMLSGFAAPIAGALVARYSLVPTVRGLFVFGFVMMTTKFVTLNAFAEETNQGRRRKIETAEKSIFELLRQYVGVVSALVRNRATVAAILVLLAVMIYNTVRNAFWAVLLTEGLLFPAESLSWFHALRSGVLLFVYLVIVPKLNHSRVTQPLLAGFGFTAMGLVCLIAAPERSVLFVVTATVLEASGYAISGPFMETLLVRAVDPAERARILALANVAVIAVTSPFGWVAGVLSERAKTMPFVMLLGIMAIAVLSILYYRRKR
jgi:MFS family permease